MELLGAPPMKPKAIVLIGILLILILLVMPVSADTWLNASRSIGGKGPSGTMLDLGFQAAGVSTAQALNYYNWISIGLLYLIAAVAGSRDTRFFAILLPIFAGILYWIGWLTAVTGFDLSGMLVFLGVLGAAYYMKDAMREKFGMGGAGSTIVTITFYIIILSAVVGLVNTSNLWGLGNMQMSAAVNNSMTNVQLSSQVSDITGAGGILQNLVSDVMILTTMAFSGLRAFLSIMISIGIFSLTICQIFPFITTSPMAMAFLVVLQVAIWLLYAKFIMDMFYKAPLQVDF